MNITGNNSDYVVGKMVAKNSRFLLYSCNDLSGRELLLQIPVADNSVTAKNAYILQSLAFRSLKTEEEYRKVGGNGDLNYDLGFPELCDSFMLKAKQVNVLGFKNVVSVGSIVPVVKIWKDNLRVDLRTSAWMMGKLLKLLSFAHEGGSGLIQIGNISGNNVLIEPDQHYVIVFDWSNAVVHDCWKSAIVRNDIKAAAQLIVRAIGGFDCATAEEMIYVDYLRLLSVDGESSASKAHKAFYDIVDSLCENERSVWAREFYKFTTFERKGE